MEMKLPLPDTATPHLPVVVATSVPNFMFCYKIEQATSTHTKSIASCIAKIPSTAGPGIVSKVGCMFCSASDPTVMDSS